MADIQVYASLPFAVILGAELDISPTNWRWVHCLTFPVDTLNEFQFSLKPYKWMRYATGVVVGAEGDLSSSPDSPNAVDYNAGLPSESAVQVLYYHTSDEEKRRMFPADPKMGHSHITSSDATTLREHFYNGVAERDGRECVLSRIEEKYCDAVHLIAHSKGDAYISTYTRRRSRDPTGGDIVEDINSIRSGLLLNKFTHGVLDEYIAFLMTPNFAMDTNDIDPNAPSSQKRCTAHLFHPDRYSLGDPALSSGIPLRISDNSEYPPTILFDAGYASAILCHFGTQTLKDDVATTWKETFYHVSIGQEKSDTARKRQTLSRNRQARSDTRSDMLDILMGLPYMLMPKDQLKAMVKESEEKEKVMEQKRVQEKVSAWMREI